MPDRHCPSDGSRPQAPTRRHRLSGGSDGFLRWAFRRRTAIGPARRWAALISVVVGSTCLALTGCVYVVTTESTTSAQAALLAADSLQWVREGETTREALEAALGAPLSVEATESGGEALIYSCRTHTAKKVHVPLVLRKRREATQVCRVTFEVADGVVVGYRREVSP
jgi:hypothetical protein